MSKVFIIAEAGVNHNGSIETARQLIDAAKEAGADAVKFQTFRTEYLVSLTAPKAEYQKNNAIKDEPQFAMLKKAELGISSHRALIDYCKRKNIEFLSSPFDLESIDLLHELGLETFKIPSGEITNLPYLRRLGSLKKEVILSTGMADIKEVSDALTALTDAGTNKENITILHCNTEYPTAFEDVNLLAMLSLKKEFDVTVGYSDHTLGIEIPIAAAALGARVIEKHFTLNRKLNGPDHKASLEPTELKNMVSAIRNIEKALGDGVKKPSLSEIKNKKITRKSIFALRDIKKGEILTEENIIPKRPAVGISPMNWDSIINTPAKRNFRRDETIEV